MAIETAPATTSPEVREGMFRHDTEGHVTQDVVFSQWEATDIPLERATVEQDEKEGWDGRVGPVRLDLTQEQGKYEKDAQKLEEALQQPEVMRSLLTAVNRGYRLPPEIIVPVKVGKRDPREVSSNPQVQREMAAEAWNRFIDELKSRLGPEVATKIHRQILKEREQRRSKREAGK